MKKRKNKGVKRLREPSLKKMLLQEEICGVLAVVLFGLIATGVFLKWRMKVEYQDCFEVYDTTFNNLNDDETRYYQELTRSKNAYNSYRGKILWNMKNISFLEESQYHDFAAVIVEKEGDGYNILHNSKQAVAARFLSDEDDSFLSFSNFDDNDNQREVKKLMLNSEYTIEMENCYICRTDSTKYKPGIIKIYKPAEPEAYKTVDCTPNDVKGYEYIDLKEGPWHAGIQNLLVGSKENSSSMDSIETNLKEYLEDARFQLDENGKYAVGDEIGFEELHYFKESKVVTGASFLLIVGDNTALLDVGEEEAGEKGLIPLDNDFVLYHQSNPSTKVVYLVMEQRFCLWDEHKGLILTAWLIALLCTLLLTSFIVYLQFRSKKMKWEKEQYRITLMNTMAHDLKSPLMVLSGYAENLKELLASSDGKQRHYVNSIMDNVQYMNDMIVDVIELSKLEQTQEEAEREEVELSGLVRETMNRYQDILTSKEIEVNITGEAIKKVEKRAMLRVIDNIVSNAVCYTPKGEKIVITINDEFMEIRNTGVTVSKEFCSEAFLPFVKGDSARGNEQGNGLGLAIVRELLKQCNMSCEMQAEENEVRVVVYF